eukprot:m.138777 g.138777  ORF g.138777 m.138777 type:complete len:227 (+) comp52543_c0_seq2:71-751(+)
MEVFTDAELLARQKAYWEKCTANVDGMLGGFAHVHDMDTRASEKFVDRIIPKKHRLRALDCGAGIGRVTRSLLLPAGFETVDLLDVSQTFLDTARREIGPKGLGNSYCSGLAEFDFAHTSGLRWNLIWVQWCAIYLKDDAFVEFFQRACAHLAAEPDSFVVLKENILSKEGPAVVDESDASVTRCDAHLKRLWTRAGLQVVHEETQQPWPSSLFPVRFYAVAPIRS